MMDVVRSEASLGEVASYINEHAESFSPPETDKDAQQEEVVTHTRRVMNLSNLVDQPLYSVRAKPWTRVTDDDYLVSHLISLYFTWEHPFFVRFDKELFLEDMIEERSTFCSPLLMNAILAHAAVSVSRCPLAIHDVIAHASSSFINHGYGVSLHIMTLMQALSFEIQLHIPFRHMTSCIRQLLMYTEPF